MESKLFNKSTSNGIQFSNKFNQARRVSKFKSIYDESSQNTIVMVDLDRATVYDAKEFYDYVNELLDDNKTNIIIDMENVYFMDSVFFGTLIKLLKKADKNLGYIKLIVDYKSKPELLSISNFDGIFEIFPNLYEAVNTKKVS